MITATMKTFTAYKFFYCTSTGQPTTLFVGDEQPLPVGEWLEAKDMWSFVNPKNGRRYVPSYSNPNRRTATGKRKNRKTGASVLIPQDEQVRRHLLEHGFIRKASAKKVTALAYRPGFHACLLPYFPQGGTKRKGSAYGNVHEWNQVCWRIEVQADRDWTDFARSQPKARTERGKLKWRDADLDFLPADGFYRYATNPKLCPQDGEWIVCHRIRIVDPVPQDECDAVLKAHGLPAQEWEQGRLELSALGLQFDGE